MVKKGSKRKLSQVQPKKTEENVIQLKETRMSDEPIPKKVKWVNRQRVLVFASRSIKYRDRHLMEDLKKMMPHHKTESKMERSKSLSLINELCEMKNCNNALFFEGRKLRDLYLWMANVPSGPSVKFYVENVHTMSELRLTGNCLRGSRPLLSFDPKFSEIPHYMLMKDLIMQIFGVPNHHPKSQPFFDHVYMFQILDNRIWFRNYQILSEDGALNEIGPRFVLNPVKIFSGSFGGVALWENATYTSPAKVRREILTAAKNRYVGRKQDKEHAAATKPTKDFCNLTPLDDIFEGDPFKKAQELKKQMDEEDEMENVETVKPIKKKQQNGVKKAIVTKKKQTDAENEMENVKVIKPIKKKIQNGVKKVIVTKKKALKKNKPAVK